MFAIKVKGDVEVIAQLRSISPRASLRIAAATGRLVLQLQRKVQRDKLSGQVLQVRTGTLRRSIDQQVVKTPDRSAGIVSTNVEYAPAHEYGAKGVPTVREQLQKSKQAWARSMAPERGLAMPRAHRFNQPERSFLRSALADMKPEIFAAYERAAADIASGSSRRE